MGIANAIADSAQIIYHGLAVTENRFENSLLMLAWRKVDSLCHQCPKLMIAWFTRGRSGWARVNHANGARIGMLTEHDAVAYTGRK